MPNGGVIGKANIPTTSVASGLWSLRRLFGARVAGIWPEVLIPVEYLVIAGGGGGGGAATNGNRSSGGGGAGGLLTNIGNPTFLPASATITVGAGGSGGVGNVPLTAGGLPSAINSLIVAIGGGFGQSPITGGTGGGGGSGGGAYTGGGTGGLGTAGQGNNGGNANNVGGIRGAGGGGASAAGQNGTSTSDGNGGAGLGNAITGVSVVYAGGGGGGRGGSGGSGGGGNGGAFRASGFNGGANLGGGGGGANGEFGVTYTGGNGGSGVVIIRYPDTFQDLLIGAGLQYADSGGTTQNGAGTRVAPSYTPTGFKVYEFRGGTGNVEF